MAMTHTSPEVVELVALLREKFGLPEGCVGFTLSCHLDSVVRIDAAYHPGKNPFPLPEPEGKQ